MIIADSNITGLILAAGESKRMGIHKALLEFDDGTTILAKQVLLLNESGCASVGIITGAQAEAIKGRHIELEAWWIRNENWQLGQFSSIQVGIDEALHDDPDGIILLPVDVIGVKKDTIVAIIETALRNPHTNVIVPEYDGRGGHPIYISYDFCDRLLELSPTGIESRLDLQIKKEKSIISLPVGDPNILGSVNTSEEWEEKKHIAQHI